MISETRGVSRVDRLHAQLRQGLSLTGRRTSRLRQHYEPGITELKAAELKGEHVGSPASS